MKKISLLPILMMILLIAGISSNVFSQANTSLSNLVSPTSVNQSLIPSSTNTKNLGSSSLAWKDGWFMGKLSIGSTATPSTMLDIMPPTTSAGAINLKPNSALIPSTSELRFSELSGNGTNYIGFKAPSSISANKIWILPSADGTSGQVLSTNGSGTLSWATVSGNISGLTTNYIPKWNGTALVNGILKDTASSITNGTFSKKGRLTIYRNTGLIVDDGVSAVQGIGTTSVGGTIYSKGFLAAKDLNELVDQTFNPPFSSGLDNAGVFGYITSNATADGAGVIGYTKGTGTSNYGTYGLSLATGTGNYGSYNKAAGTNGSFGFNIGTYGEATNSGGTNAGVWGNGIATATSINTYGVYGTASGTTGSVYAGYFQGDVYVSNHLKVNDSIRTYSAFVLGTANRPHSFEFAVTGGADAYIDDVLSVHTTTATAQLNVKGTSETILMEGTTPYLKLTDGTNQSSFLQASGNHIKIGTLNGNSNGKLIFRFNGTDKNAMDVNGKLGLGTTSPSALLHLKGSNEVLRIEGTDAFIQFYSGTVAKSFIFRTGEDLKIGTSSGNTSGKVILSTATGGEQLFVLSDGTVGIGTSATAGYKLAVDGSVVCEELRVKLSDNWPDYVFASEYKLPSLLDLEKSIQLNKHLPGIPSATEIHEEGINIGEMQKLLVQKVEELTLYVIDLQKQNDELRLQVAGLKH